MQIITCFQYAFSRSCPECRVHSDYIIPSSTWVEDQSDKDKLTALYQDNMKQKQCKYVKQGRVDDCPFGNKCFYKHQLPNGKCVSISAPIRPIFQAASWKGIRLGPCGESVALN